MINLFFIKQVFADSPSVNDVIGQIKPSIELLQTNAVVDGKLLGPVMLMNSILKLVFVVAGIWAFLNFIIAGYGFLSAGGDAKAVTKSWDRIWQSFVGVLFIVASFLLAAILGILLFHDATAILQPTL